MDDFGILFQHSKDKSFQKVFSYNDYFIILPANNY